MWFVVHHLAATAPLFIQNEGLFTYPQRLNQQEVKLLMTCIQKALLSTHELTNCTTVTHQDRRKSRFVSESIGMLTQKYT